MAISLETMSIQRAAENPRILIYGEPGVGKTTLAAEFPNPVIQQLEDGNPVDVRVPGWGRRELVTFNDVMDSMAVLFQGEHDRQTLIVDSVTALERMVFAETCRRGDEKGNKKKNIEEFGYGKGYVAAEKVWQEFIDGFNALRDRRGMNIVLLAHSAVERFNDPERESYDRYEIDLHKRSVGLIEQEVDAILLVKKSVKLVEEESGGFGKKRLIGAGGETRWIHAEGTAALTAKNRFDMPPKFIYEKGKGYNEIAQYLPRD